MLIIRRLKFIETASHIVLFLALPDAHITATSAVLPIGTEVDVNGCQGEPERGRYQILHQ
jgi:hypothetical protein